MSLHVPRQNDNMRKLISSNIRKYVNWLVSRKSTLSWSPFLKKRRLLSRFILRIVGLSVIGKKTRSLGGAAIAFSRYVVKLYRSSGAKGVTQYLKKCQLLLMQSLGHSSRRPVCLSDTPRVATTRTGIPRIIPAAHRKMIEQGDKLIIQLWMTLFAFHRVVTIKGEWKMSSIYRGYSNWKIPLRIHNCYIGVSPDGSPVGFKYYIPEFFIRLRLLEGLKVLPKPDWKFEPLLINSIGPNSVEGYKSMMTAPQDALAWSSNPLLPALRRFCHLTGMKGILDLIHRCSYMSSIEDIAIHDMRITFKDPFVPGTKKRKKFNPRVTDPKELIFEPTIFSSPFIRYAPNLLTRRIEALGRLSFKREKSGKIRVFAMVDYWTQCLLKPLHDCIFNILRLIPQDATFDQQASVKSLVESLGTKSKVYSYDLSSATDRLPVVLQVEVLSSLLGNPELAVLWAMLLTCRTYFVRRKKIGDVIPRWGEHRVCPAILGYPTTRLIFPAYSEYLRDKGELYTCNRRVAYGVGQPMGAYTSWAMLALTHHFIVQLAYMKSYPESRIWFRDYRVLGDDCVIADELVAAKYVQLMRLLGVPLNESKGLVSDNGSLEFAKTYWYKTEEVSPHSWADMRLGIQSLPGMILLFSKNRRKPRFLLPQLARAFGFGSVCSTRVMRKYAFLYKEHPRLIPFLFTATFPETTPVSFKEFAVWLRAVRASPNTELLPEASVSKQLGTFWWKYLRPKMKCLSPVYHLDSFNNYFSKTGVNALNVLKELEGKINLRLEDCYQQAKEDIKEVELCHKIYDEQNQITRAECMFKQYLIAAEAADAYPLWYTPKIEDQFPAEVDKLQRWTRYKLSAFLKSEKVSLKVSEKTGQRSAYPHGL